MALNDVVFIKGQGGLGRPLPGKDYISGFVFYTSTLPSGFITTNNMKHILSIDDAKASGINLTYSDETKATGSYLFTAAGATGDIIELKVQEFGTANNLTGLVSLGAYTRLSTDTTVNLLATSYATYVNSGTSIHGYSATATTGTVTITARTGLGVFLNTGTPLVAVITGTIAGTITQFSGGVYSKLSQWYYHISEYFRLNPKGDLYVGFFAIPTTYDFSEIQTLQNFANGEVRQFAAFADSTTYTSAKVQAAHTIATTLDALHKNTQVLLTFDYSAATLSSLADLSQLNSNKVSVIIGQDGFNLGNAIFKATGRSITSLGAVLGLVSASAVSDDIAWIAKYNIAGGAENDVAAFANGQLYTAQSASLFTYMDSFRYIFLIKQTGSAGTWVNDSHTCTLMSSDSAYIENNRTIDKAIRNLRTFYLPALSSPIRLNAVGTLSDVSVAYFQGLGNTALDQMVRDGEISGKTVTVDPTQNVLSTSVLRVAVQLLGIGVARNIQVGIKYVLSL